MITAVVMIGEAGGKEGPGDWLRRARRAAARDLIAQLARQGLIRQIVVLSPRWEPDKVSVPLHHMQTPPGPIHVGQWLVRASERFEIGRLLYFGGGAAPLLTDATLEMVLERLATIPEGILANNRFASDWVGVTPASSLAAWQERLPLDNMLGWVLSTEAGLTFHSVPPSSESRLDIDTPTDLLTLKLHPRTKHHLRQCLQELLLDTAPLERAIMVLRKPASHVFIAGRIGPEAWQALNAASSCWLRVVAEERGMVSSGRQARGEVFSLLADYIDHLGPETFFTMLAQRAQAAFIDTRVLFAHHGLWPEADERFAADLGLLDQVSDPWLARFSRAVKQAPLPVVVGGHGLMAGNLFAIADMLSSSGGMDASKSRRQH